MSSHPLRTATFATLIALATAVTVADAAEAPQTVRPLADLTAGGVDAPLLRHLPSSLRSTRLSGETDRITWPVWVTAAEAAGGAKLRLTHVAAVSVMPEASHLSVAINDRALPDLAIGAGGAPRSVDLAVPAGLLQPGWNAIRVAVDQRHRVDCSTASTYELWTEIDRARSGLLFPAGHKPERRGIADIAGIAPDEHGRVAIRLVAGEPADAKQLERAIGVAQALALVGGFLDPVVSVTRRVEAGPGIDVVVGRAAAGLVDAGAVPPGAVTVIDDGEPDHLTVAILGDDGAIDRALAQLADVAAKAGDGSAAGLEARADLGGRRIASGERIRLADLGAETTEFSGRLFRAGFDLRLPADLYAADYAKVRLRLSGGHAPGLDRSSRLTVRVNGRQAAGAPIVAPRGEIFTDRVLQIPLSAFRPGQNRIEIEAAVATAADKTCDPAVQIEGPKRFLFVDRSELVFPTFARLARLPDLAATAGGVLGALSPEARPVLHVPRPDLAGLSAAATLATRMAVAAGRVDVMKLAFRNPSVDAPSAIVVGAFADLPTTVVGAVGLEPGLIRSAWARRPVEQQASAIPATGTDALTRRVASLRVAGLAGEIDPITTGSLQGRVMTLAPSNDAELVDRWRRSMESPWSAAAVGRAAGARLEKLVDFLPNFGADRPLQGFTPTATTGLVIAQAMSPGGGAWTLVTAPTSRVLADAVATVTGGEDWTRLEGAASTWDQADETVSSIPANHVGFLATAGFDFANLRLVAAALASDYPFVYILAALLVTGVLGLATARLLPSLGKTEA